MAKDADAKSAAKRERDRAKKQARRKKVKEVKAEKKAAPAKAVLAVVADDVEYVPAHVGLGDDPSLLAYQEIFERFKVEAPEEEEKSKEPKQPKLQKAKPKLLQDGEESSDDDSEPRRISKRKTKQMIRMTVAQLKQSVKRPDVIESWDNTSSDAKLLVYLKAYRNTVPVPRHWCAKRKYMSSKRGYEKPPFKLPEFIEATGIARIREAVMERESAKSMKGKQRDKVRPKMGKLDIDYQVLHDAFFKYSTKIPLTKHGELYFEGKENEVRIQNKTPGQLSDELQNALGMGESGPPPYLLNMQRYGPPPSYPTLKIPGLNAPIPPGAEYGYHTGGWGKPPVNEYGQPLYGAHDESKNKMAGDDLLWGEVEDADEEDEEDEDEAMDDGAATPALGTATPFGVDTPIVSMGSEGGVRSISGVSSVTSGLETPSSVGLRGKRGIQSVSGISSATMTPQPQLFQVLEQQRGSAKGGLFPSQHTYKVGVGTPVAGIATPGLATPGIATPQGISTPIGGIATPQGISTPIGGIATPQGIATPIGGIATPIGGISTPIGGIQTPAGVATPIGGIATPIGGLATPAGARTPVGLPQVGLGGSGTPVEGLTMSLNPGDVEAEGVMTADIIRQQLKAHEQQADAARAAAGQKANAKEKKRKDKEKQQGKKKFKF
jgi:splicing factor 3B subunit 2